MSAAASGVAEAKVTFWKSAMATKTPIVMPSRAISFAIRSCTSGVRPAMPLSSQAVKPWSAANLSWSTRSSPAWPLNIPKWGAYLRWKPFAGAAAALATRAPAEPERRSRGQCRLEQFAPLHSLASICSEDALLAVTARAHSSSDVRRIP